MKSIDLSVVIVNHAGGPNLKTCLESFMDRTDSYSEIIIVDCASPSGSYVVPDLSGTAVKWIQLHENKGYGTGCNAGAAIAKSKFLMFLNNDTLVDPDLLVRMMTKAKNTDEAVLGCFGCILTDKKGVPVHSFGHFPGIVNQIAIWKNRLSKGMIERAELRSLLIVRERFVPVDYVTGAAMIVNRTTFMKTGGFDEGFFMYFEDTELQFRMKNAGFPSHLYCDTGIVHLECGGEKRKNDTRIATYESMMRYKRKTLGGKSYFLFRMAFSPFVMLHLFNRNFRFRENAGFVAAIAGSMFGRRRAEP